MPRLRLPRPLWIAVATVVMVVAFLGIRILLPAYHRIDAVRDIRERGGQIEFRQVGPEWLRRLVGEERIKIFDEIDGIRYRPEGATFESRFRKLSETSNVTITPDDYNLRWLTQAPYLHRLDLRWSNSTDADLQEIVVLKDLRELNLKGLDISDASVLVLSRQQSLQKLDLTGTRMSASGFAQLRAALPDCDVIGERQK